jgi:hypothetical protein
MRFMMIMFPKSYENAKPGTVPDLKDMEAMGKYNEQLQKAGDQRGQEGCSKSVESLRSPGSDAN